MGRILTAAVGIPLVVAIVEWGPVWLLALLTGGVAAMALDEYLELAAPDRDRRPGRVFLGLGAGVTASFTAGTGWAVGVLAFAILALLAGAIRAGPPPVALERVKAGAAGLVYACMLLGFVVLLPRPAILVLLGIVWAGDTAAYYGGRALGRNRLAPRISPNKTIEGAVAGALASVAVGMLLGGWRLGLPYGWLALVSLVTASAAQLGDLAESAMKRGAGVKDSGSRLPGHGGFLDRIDSLLFAAPVFYFLLRI